MEKKNHLEPARSSEKKSLSERKKNLSGNERRKGKKKKRKHSFGLFVFYFFYKKKKQNQDIMLCLSFLKENYIFFPFERKKQN